MTRFNNNPRAFGVLLAAVTLAVPAALAVAAPNAGLPVLALVLPFLTMSALEGRVSHDTPSASA